MFYYDSYAIIEIAKKNPRYAKYRVTEGVTSKLNLLEVYYVFLQEGAEELADLCYRNHLRHAIDFPGAIIPQAALFRLRTKGATGHRFSYADALGYVYAREWGYQFLTGAEEFQGFPDVEYVR